MKKRNPLLVISLLVYFGIFLPHYGFSQNTGTLDVNGPAPIAGNQYVTCLGLFGPTLVGNPVTGNVVIVDDGVSTPPFGTPTDGCEPLVNGGAVSGNIALVDRGTCLFSTKVDKAEDVGAIAVLICNDDPGNACTPPGAIPDSTALIPVVMIGMDDCNFLRTFVGSGLNITLTAPPPAPIPTMSQWGLFLFGLLVFTVCLVVAYNIRQDDSRIQRFPLSVISKKNQAEIGTDQA